MYITEIEYIASGYGISVYITGQRLKTEKYAGERLVGDLSTFPIRH